jgi:cytochrome c oxidase assembly factor CtaG
MTLALLLAALVYTRGWYRFRSTLPNMIPIWRVASFVAGLLSVWIAIGSPIAHRDHELLSIHMVQHLLLMAIGAPLILLGAPVLLWEYGLPQRLSGVSGPLFGWSQVHAIAQALTRPAVCWLAGTVAVIGWHVPAAFELAMRSHGWHDTQRATFLAAGILFWRPIIEPWPRVAQGMRWSVPLYLFLGTLPCDVLSAFLTFSDRVVYHSYLSGPQLFGLSALHDQETAGALMWVSVTFIYLIPAVVVTIRLLGDRPA